MAVPVSHHVEANGIRLHYIRNGAGLPLLLLHGWPEYCRVWEPVMQRLAPRFDLIAPDLRGFGDSDKPEWGPSADVAEQAHAADLHALLARLGIGR
jgi:pimeloyl-ACP methyl ester carboxylesterase